MAHVSRRSFAGAFPEPAAAKVPQITATFWVIKLLTTAGGEAASDYLALGSHVVELLPTQALQGSASR